MHHEMKKGASEYTELPGHLMVTTIPKLYFREI
jgi:hypothetical protein